MEPIPIPPRSILLREKIKQLKFMPPEGNDAIKGLEDCGTLEVLVEPTDEEHDLPRLHSFWVLSEEDMEKIQEGVPIRVTISGQGLSPMALTVDY